MKGKDTLENKEVPKVSIQQRTNDRNNMLAARYYYYSYLVQPRRSYELIIHQLANEIYLQESTLLNILFNLRKVVKQHVADGTTIEQLRTLYPHLQW